MGCSAPPTARPPATIHTPSRSSTPAPPSGRLKWDLLTTLPWEVIVLEVARMDCGSRNAAFVTLIGLLKLVRLAAGAGGCLCVCLFGRVCGGGRL